MIRAQNDNTNPMRVLDHYEAAYGKDEGVSVAECQAAMNRLMAYDAGTDLRTRLAALRDGAGA